jgi:hypothetical protein
MALALLVSFQKQEQRRLWISLSLDTFQEQNHTKANEIENSNLLIGRDTQKSGIVWEQIPKKAVFQRVKAQIWLVHS